MKISVIGVGNVGLVTSLVFEKHGFDVIGIDNNIDKIKSLNKRKTCIYEKDLDKLLKCSKVFFTNDYNYINETEIIFICVPTPMDATGDIDLSIMDECVKSIITSLKKDITVCIKSTVIPGTSNGIQDYFNSKCSYKVSVINNPEFLSQGSAVYDMESPDRIVVGFDEDNKLIRKIYEDFNVPKIYTGLREAELIKYASNSFLAMKISFINMISFYCDKEEIDICDVSDGIGLDHRIGREFLNSGIGFGGSCFKKDISALSKLFQKNDISNSLLISTLEVNSLSERVLVKKLCNYYSNIEGLNIAILGASFKPNTNDISNSPVLRIIDELISLNANIRVYDPKALDEIKNIYGDKISLFKSIDECITNSDACLIVTAWNDIKDYNIDNFIIKMNKPIIIDGRNCFDWDLLKDKSIIYDSIGRKVINNLKDEL